LSAAAFTGLWTARELLRRDPTLRVAVLEKEVCGFGASGRNGGWASGLFPMSNAKRHPALRPRVLRTPAPRVQDAVVELGSSTRDDGIDARYEQQAAR